MTINRHPSFKKAYKKRIASDSRLIAKTKVRVGYFVNNPFHPLLQDHPLKGSREGLRAFSVTGDIRIIYRRVNNDTVEFLDIGTHNQVYR